MLCFKGARCDTSPEKQVDSHHVATTDRVSSHDGSSNVHISALTTVTLVQVFLEHTAGAKGEELEREMFILRKVIEKAKAAKLADGLDGLSDFYICTMSSKTIVYKV